MVRVAFTDNIQRHVECPTDDAIGHTVREVLDETFASNPRARLYVLDEQGRLRKHMHIFVDGEPIHDRVSLSDAVQPNSEIYVMQALSGG